MKRHRLLSIVAALAATEAGAQPLGRLFYTPAQRAQIVAARHSAADNAADRPGAPTVVRLSGIVRSGRGGMVAWIDGRLVADGGTYAGFVVRVGDSGVRLVGGGRELSLRAGERIDLASGARESVTVVRAGRAR